MQVTRTGLDDAVAAGLLTREQSAALWAFLARREESPTFKPAHILYYFGGMIAIGAMTLFMTLGWERFGGSGLVLIAAGYGFVALAATEILLSRNLSLPAGITAALAVVMVPLAVYGAQHALGFWPPGVPKELAYRDYHSRVDWRWLIMEFATLAAGMIALWRYRLPFLVMPVAVTLWYMSMDLIPFLLGGEPGAFFSQRGKWISSGFGIAMTAVAIWIDVRVRTQDKDFPFWLYVFGVLAFWAALTSMNSDSEWGKFVYFLINVLLVALGAALSRRVFAVFGALGIAIYLGHLSHTLFKDSMLFPVALTAIGLLVMACGIQWQRHEMVIGAALRSVLPRPLQELVERRAGS